MNFYTGLPSRSEKTSRRAVGVSAFTLAGLLAGAVAAQDVEPRDFSTYQPEVAPMRIERNEAPKIDGDLSDPVWTKATKITEFYQVEPAVGEPSEKTTVYLAYDENNLYVAIRADDSEPEKILTTILERDGDVWRDDMVRFYIDPFNTGLSGYGFDVNALGARADRLVQARRRPIDEWDTIWDSAGKVTDAGWQAEFVIPFRSISFDPEADGWSLMLTRELSRKNEEIRWAAIDRSITAFDFRRPGKIVGIKDVDQGIGLDVNVAAKMVASRDWPRPRNDSFEIEPTGDIYYKFTPGLTGLITVNSDFSDTPLDEQQVRTDRFALFFPETRDFFLQDAAQFEFGGNSFSSSPFGNSFSNASNGLPFFSRRIGLVNGRPVDLRVGAKLSGEYKGFELGMLSARMGSQDLDGLPSVDGQTLSVARVTRPVLQASRIGFIATHGDPSGTTSNTLYGADFLYRRPKFFNGGMLEADMFYLRSSTDDIEDPSFAARIGKTDDHSYGARISYPNDRWNWNVAYRHVGQDYRPGLGFVNRPGTTAMEGTWRRRYRPDSGPFRWWQIGSDHAITNNALNEENPFSQGLNDGGLQTRNQAFIIAAENHQSDNYSLSAFENEEVVNRDFRLPGGIVVPAGRYQSYGVRARFNASNFRAYGVNADIQYRDFFGGTSFRTNFALTARPSPYWNVTARYRREDISLPTGDVMIHIGSVDGVFNFTPDISMNLQAQYQNTSERLTLFGRLRWELRPETELFLSLGHGAFVRRERFPTEFESQNSQIILRFSNRFQF